MTSWRLMLGFFALSVAHAAHPQNVKSTQPRHSELASREVLKLEDEWARALVRRDTAMFRRHLAPNFVYTENADLMGKEDVIKGVVGSDTVTWAGNEGMQAHAYGNTIVVTGILAMRGHGKGGVFSKRYRFTDTWMRLGGMWQIVAAQDYLLPN